MDLTQFRKDLSALAAKDIYIGTSSWKYPGWQGQIYDHERYVWRNKFSEKRFNENCLAEYAQTFSTVCVDAAYYKFPDREYLQNLVSQVPEKFLFTFKVTDEITIKDFPNLPRFGARAGRANPNFLNAALFVDQFLGPCSDFKRNVGVLMFEFSRFNSKDFPQGADFAAALDRFLGALPKGWNYGVEIRNRNFLSPEYFRMLASHGVTHVFNSWSDMPGVDEQLNHAEALSGEGAVAARFLLKPGRGYEKAVKEFSPYTEIKDTYEEGRAAAAELIRKITLQKIKRLLMIYINNRFEGNAILTIQAILSILKANRLI